MLMHEKFLQFPHSNRGKLLSIDKNQLTKWRHLIEKKKSGKMVFLLHSHAPFFAIHFLMLLDFGFFPICLSSDINHFLKSSLKREFPNSLWFEEGEWTENKEKPKNEEVLPIETSKVEPYYCCLSSGTTGKPRLILLSVKGALQNAHSHGLSFHLRAPQNQENNHSLDAPQNFHQRLIQTLPIHHSFGIVSYIWTSLVFQLPIDFSSPTLQLSSLKSWPCLNSSPPSKGILYCSPSQARQFLKELKKRPFENPPLDIISIGGGSMDYQTISELFFLLKDSTQLLVSYGLTEAGPRVSSGFITEELLNKWKLRNSHQDFSSFIGFPIPGVHAHIQPDLEDAEKNNGWLILNSPSCALNLPENQKIIEKPGYFMTRDKVHLGEDGSLWFLSRKEDIIKCSGFTIYPSDIEGLALSFSGVTDACVMKIKDALYEEVPILFVEGSVDVSQLDDFLSLELTPIQRPRKIISFSQFPRQSLNKINRALLLERIFLEI